MKRNHAKAMAVAMLLAVGTAELCAQSAIYACGHIRRTRTTAITKLKNSGYTTAILFNVDVAPDGTLMTDYNWDKQEAAEAGGIICRDGKYVFGNYQPEYAKDVKNLVTAPTSINRIEICIGGWGNGAYGNIRDLIRKYGSGEETMLYRNFKALKEAIPEIVAVNNDQEQDYDLETAVEFHQMMAELGYKTTVAPYMNRNYWRDLVARLNETPGTCDLVYLQTYGGGWNNKPSEWKVFGDVPMYVGFDCESNGNLGEMRQKFEQWRENDGVAGGFLWNYNSEARDVNEWATAINRVFGTKCSDRSVATFYQDINYGGYAVSLPEGVFTQSEMALYGLKAKDITSFKINEGYKVTLYKGARNNGTSKSWTEAVEWIGNDWNDQASSIKIESTGTNSIDLSESGSDNGLKIGMDPAGDMLTVGGATSATVAVYSMSGERLLSVPAVAGCNTAVNISTLPKGVYLVRSGDAAAKVVRR